MIKLTNELKANLLAAKGVEEAAALLKDAGVDEPLAEQIWNELTHQREADGRELSLDELEAVSGGADRNWATEGCAATVEYGSWCGSNDKCIYWSVTYDFQPTSTLCPNCGKNMYLQDRIHHGDSKYEEQYRCRFCGCITSRTYDDEAGNDYTYRQ